MKASWWIVFLCVVVHVMEVCTQTDILPSSAGIVPTPTEQTMADLSFNNSPIAYQTLSILSTDFSTLKTQIFSPGIHLTSSSIVNANTILTSVVPFVSTSYVSSLLASATLDIFLTDSGKKTSIAESIRSIVSDQLSVETSEFIVETELTFIASSTATIEFTVLESVNIKENISSEVFSNVYKTYSQLDFKQTNSSLSLTTDADEKFLSVSTITETVQSTLPESAYDIEITKTFGKGSTYHSSADISTPLNFHLSTTSMAEMSALSKYSFNTPDQASSVSKISSSFTDSILSTQLTPNQSFYSAETLTLKTTEVFSSSSSDGRLSSAPLSTLFAPSMDKIGLNASSSVVMDKTTALAYSSSEIYSSTLNGIQSDQITPKSDLVLSSFSSTYDPPVISTLKNNLGTSSYETVIHTSEQSYTFSSTIIRSNIDGIKRTISSSVGSIAPTTPHDTGVTSAFSKMPSSTPTAEDFRPAELQTQIDDLNETVNGYKIAVVVLALVIVLLITLIVLYIIRRRRYYQRKLSVPPGMDEDLLKNDGTKMRQHNRTYFDTAQTGELRISGRMSTASLENKDSEPLSLLESFNKTRNQTLLESTTENGDNKNKIDNIKDEEL
ncbi:uncharacterized protein LOC143042321 [Mytilus galloprovincialis]|uniref:uncharacterized protein LOC143042321 n=1 Tax=Mytilus galloprovincialis TaxID=29158 RepID=UPI003F7C0BAB